LYNVPINAHRDGEVAHHCKPVAFSDASSTIPSPECAVSDSTGAERPHLNRGRHKWTRDENIELMRCLYLAKQDGKGYQSRLKCLWDSRNPSKVSVSVNTLCCHARNIQTANMLTSYELTRIKEFCVNESDLTSVTSAVATAPDPLMQSYGNSVAPCDESEKPNGDSAVLEQTLLFEECDNYIDELLLTLSSSPAFRGNTAVLEMLLYQFKELRQLSVASYPRLSRTLMSKKLRETIDEVNHCIGLITSLYRLTLEQCVRLLYSAILVVNKPKLHCYYSPQNCPWQCRLENKISALRRDVSRLVAGGYPSRSSGHFGHLLRHLYKRYKIKCLSSFLTTLETLKQRITCYATRLRIYKSRVLRRKQNSLFRHNEKAFYTTLQQNVSKDLPFPDLQDLQSFWQGLFEKTCNANLQASWLNELSSVSNETITEASHIDEDCFSRCVSKLRNWASPGPDGIQGFWIKQFPALHQSLLLLFNGMMKNDSCVPSWFPSGRTLLIPKNANTSMAKSFRPITCLNVLYKLWTSCITELMVRHCELNNILHPAQKGCVRGQFGSTDHLLLNSRLWHQVKSKSRSMSVAWLDYRKAFDSVPHNWIIYCLQLYQFDPVVIKCIENLLHLWRTTLFLRMPHSDPVKLLEVSVKCGIFQGDTLSPLLFCIALNPLSTLLDTLPGYQVTPDRQINHLLYMDDLKLYAKNDSQLHSLLSTVEMFSSDVGLSFGLDKCAKLSICRGKAVAMGNMAISSEVNIRELDTGETYKYLGFCESEGIDHAVSKQHLITEYSRRLTLVWKSLLTGPRKVRATNSFCVPLLTYGFGIVPWTIKELEQFDISTRRIMSCHSSHHPRSAVERLYLPCSVGGRGLVNVQNLFYRKLAILAHHLSTSPDSLVQLCSQLDKQLPLRVSILLRANSYCSSLNISSNWLSCTPLKIKETLCDKQLASFNASLIAKPLHGKFFSLLHSDAIDHKRSVRWLTQHLHSESESTVLAIQDQVVATRVYENKIMKKRVPSILCRVCGQAEETILHLLSACPIQAGTTYVYRHNLVARAVHYHLCVHFSLPFTAKSWFSHNPPPVCENSTTKLLWDFCLQSSSNHTSNRPDIVLFSYPHKKIYFLEISCPGDINVALKEEEKVRKYLPLARDFHLMYHMTVEVIPIVFGHTGVVSADCVKHLQKIPGYYDSLFSTLQKATLLGTIHTLRALHIN